MQDETKWQAVQKRDASMDRRFVYGVLTTGVYCRPSCAARRPLRDNVRFFDEPAAAAAAGLRPCRRCRPLEHWQDDPEIASLLRLCRLVEAEPDRLPDGAALAQAAGRDVFQLNRLFKRYLTITPGDYIENVRMRRVRHALRHSASVTGLPSAPSGSTPCQTCRMGFAREGCCPSCWASPMRIPSGPRM